MPHDVQLTKVPTEALPTVYVPGGHALHDDSPALPATVPGAHLPHELWFAAGTEPAAHAWHVPAEPGFTRMVVEAHSLHGVR